MGFAFIIAIILVVCVVVYKTTDPRQKRLIAIIFVAAFLLRVAAAVAYQWYVDRWCGGVPLAPDELYYLAVASCRMLLFKMKDLSSLSGEQIAFMGPLVKKIFTGFINTHGYATLTDSGGYVYLILLGTLYFIFGYSPLLARFFSILIGLLVALVVYLIAKLVFNKETAKLSFIFIIFLPSQVFLSVSIIRDILIIFFMTSALLLLYKIKDIKSLAIFSIPLITLLCLIFHLQLLIFYLLATFIGIFTIIKILDFKGHRLRSLILSVVILAAVFNGRVFPYLSGFFAANLNNLLQKHISIARHLDDTTYRLLPDSFYDLKHLRDTVMKADEIYYSIKGIDRDCIWPPAGFLARKDQEIRLIRNRILFEEARRFLPSVYIKGLFSVFFKPFPWRVRKATQALASAQMIFWYMLFPFMCVGLYEAFRKPAKEKFALMIFFFSFASALALGEGNVGALFRHREFISFAYIIFGANGLLYVFSREKREIKNG